MAKKPKKSANAVTQHRKPTIKQLCWVDEMMIDGNATQAAIRAGYSKKTAKQQGSENLAKPYLMELLNEKRKKRSEQVDKTALDVFRELALIGFSNVADFITIGEDGTPRTNLAKASREQLAAVSEITIEEFMDGPVDELRPVRRVKMKLADKKAALAEMGKHLGVATKHDHTVAVPVTLIYEDIYPDDNE